MKKCESFFSFCLAIINAAGIYIENALWGMFFYTCSFF
jgi:hypothetical protein